MRRRLNSRAYDPYDEWLETLGLYRKQVARDGSCLFRAVAEQVFKTQTEHERLRSLCLEYMMIHKDDFQPFLDIPLDHHVFNLQDVREWGGHLEIMAMSRLFHVNFLIYREIGQEPYKATNIEGRTLMLSFTHGNHYDIIYKRDDASSRGFCQSVIYDILYSHVFKLKDVRLAVDTMLHDKEYASLRRDSANSAELKEIGALVEKILGTNISRDSQDEGDKNASIEEKISLDDIHPDDVRGLLAHGIPPFPYKVAKSLDPDIYRNIEYDTWNTVRREARYGPFDSNGFQAGVKVLIKLDHLPNRQEVEDMRKAHINRSGNGEASESKPTDAKLDVYHGHIQEMSENKGPVDVYIEEIGSRLKVPYESLEKVPPSPPRSPWHGHPQQQLQGSGGMSAPGGGLPSYKKLSGYYQKAPLPVENEFPVGKSKKKGGKQMREPPPHNSSIRGSLGSPTAVSHSPRSRTPQGMHPQTNYNRNSHGRGMGRGTNNSFRNSASPAREDFPSFPTTASVPASVEGVWAVRPNANQSMVSSTPKSNCGSYYPTTPQPPMGEDETRLQIQAVTEALQQVMSAGGQEVRVTGQQLEVVNSTECVEDQSTPQLEGTTSVECSVLSNKVDGKVNAVSLNSEAYPVCQSDHNPSKLTGLEPVVSPPQCVNYHEDGTPQPLLYQPDPNIAFMSPPPVSQMGGVSPSPQNAAMYTVTFPPYASPTYVQMLTPVPGDGSLTPSEFTPPPSAQGRPESVDGSIHGADSEIMKTSQGMTSVMIYQVPVMYGSGGYGYGYNQPWTYVPMMSSPNAEDGKLTPVPGNELYQPMVPVSGWGGPNYMGEMMQPPPYAVPPQSVPSYPHEPPVPQYPPPPPPPAFHERPPYHHHHYRGRGRGGGAPHHYNHQNRGHHNETSPYNPHMDGMGRGGGQRPLPPRFHRGGGAPLGRGGPRYPYHINNGPPPNYQRSHQYEGQPLMQMGSRKSSTESLASQVASGGSVGSGGLASPPLVTYVEPERPPGVIPLGTQDGPPLPPQDPMAYYPTPPGYMMSGPWMWKMM